MDTLDMHRTLTDSGFTPEQAEAVVKVLQGGVATKHDLDLAVARLEARIDRLDSKINLILVAAVLAPAAARLMVG